MSLLLERPDVYEQIISTSRAVRKEPLDKEKLFTELRKILETKGFRNPILTFSMKRFCKYAKITQEELLDLVLQRKVGCRNVNGEIQFLPFNLAAYMVERPTPTAKA